MNEASGLAAILANALALGAETDVEIAAVVIPEGPATEPVEGVGGIGRFASIGTWWRTATTPPISGDQRRRLGQQFDEFATTLAPLVSYVGSESFADEAVGAATWSTGLWEGELTPPDALNQVRAMLATLHRFRVNLLLQRPIGDAPTEPGAT